MLQSQAEPANLDIRRRPGADDATFPEFERRDVKETYLYKVYCSMQEAPFPTKRTTIFS